jgi:hypothetical protein
MSAIKPTDNYIAFSRTPEYNISTPCRTRSRYLYQQLHVQETHDKIHNKVNDQTTLH